MEKQYQHILALLKEKEAILLRDKAVTERECTVAQSQSVPLLNGTYSLIVLVSVKYRRLNFHLLVQIRM